MSYFFIKPAIMTDYINAANLNRQNDN